MTHVLQISLGDWEENYNLKLAPGEDEKFLQWLARAIEEMHDGADPLDEFAYALIPVTEVPLNSLQEIVSELRDIHSIEVDLVTAEI